METPGKILLVEDDRFSRAIVAEILEQEGHVVIQASGGSNALTILEDNDDIGLVITDMLMPKMNGAEFIRTIRKTKENADLPIIVVSGVIGVKELRQLLELGSARFLPKPVVRQDLLAYIKELSGASVA